MKLNLRVENKYFEEKKTLESGQQNVVSLIQQSIVHRHDHHSIFK